MPRRRLSNTIPAPHAAAIRLPQCVLGSMATHAPRKPHASPESSLRQPFAFPRSTPRRPEGSREPPGIKSAAKMRGGMIERNAQISPVPIISRPIRAMGWRSRSSIPRSGRACPLYHQPASQQLDAGCLARPWLALCGPSAVTGHSSRVRPEASRCRFPARGDLDQCSPCYRANLRSSLAIGTDQPPMSWSISCQWSSRSLMSASVTSGLSKPSN